MVFQSPPSFMLSWSTPKNGLLKIINAVAVWDKISKIPLSCLWEELISTGIPTYSGTQLSPVINLRGDPVSSYVTWLIFVVRKTRVTCSDTWGSIVLIKIDFIGGGWVFFQFSYSLGGINHWSVMNLPVESYPLFLGWCGEQSSCGR